MRWSAILLTYTLSSAVLRLYGVRRVNALALPFAALLYTAMTVDSARRHRAGRGGAWKGRTFRPNGGG